MRLGCSIARFSFIDMDVITIYIQVQGCHKLNIR